MKRALSAETGPGRWNRSSVEADLALAALASGATERAREHARLCEEAAKVSGEPSREAESESVWAEIAAASGALPQTRARFQSAILIYQRTGDPDLEAQTRRDLGRALRRLGDEEGARSELTAARDLFDALGLVDQTERTRNLLLH